MKTYPLLDYRKYETKKYIVPRLIKLENKDNKLWYFAASHSYNLQNQMFSDIENAFNELYPDLVILEGSLKINPEYPKRQDYLSKILTKSKQENIIEKGEFRFGLFLALRSKKEVFCPEPKFEDEVNNLSKKFNKGFIFTSLVLQMAVQWNSMEIGDADLHSYLLKEIEYQKTELVALKQWKEFDFSWNNFLNNFEKATNQDFLKTSLEFWTELDDPIPWSTKKYTWNVLSDISQENCNFRDQFILNKLEIKLGEYKKVMVIYGGSHFYAQEPALNLIFKIN